jgi:hypothetical protein
MVGLRIIPVWTLRTWPMELTSYASHPTIGRHWTSVSDMMLVFIGASFMPAMLSNRKKIFRHISCTHLFMNPEAHNE